MVQVLLHLIINIFRPFKDALCGHWFTGNKEVKVAIHVWCVNWNCCMVTACGPEQQREKKLWVYGIKLRYNCPCLPSCNRKKKKKETGLGI
jgi:hypothetical protein